MKHQLSHSARLNEAIPRNVNVFDQHNKDMLLMNVSAKSQTVHTEHICKMLIVNIFN